MLVFLFIFIFLLIHIDNVFYLVHNKEKIKKENQNEKRISESIYCLRNTKTHPEMVL